MNALGQRSAVVTTGSAFASPSASSFIAYNYKGTGELLTAKRYVGTNTAVTTTPITSYDYGYAYDGIGNRSTSSSSGTTTSYVSNSTNAYTSYTRGSQISAPVYDADGNMTKYRRPNNGDAMNYTWDAENRLLSATPATPVAGDKQVINAYDGMGRRVRKQILVWSSGAWAVGSTQKFIYDGWNLVAVLDALNSNALVRTFTWGRDLSGTIQGAGGVGGLLACREVSGTAGWHSYLYDANGNVSNIGTSATSGGLTNYEYDPYGNITASAGSYLANNFTFSTKYQDDEVGLLYYGYRFYHPTMGRWINRDPSEEKGGINLYGFLTNNPVSFQDRLGLEIFEIWASAYIPDGTFTFAYPTKVDPFARWHGDNRTSAVKGGSARAYHKIKIDTDPSKKAEISNTSSGGVTKVDYMPGGGIIKIFTDSAVDSAPPIAKIKRSKNNCKTTIEFDANTSDPLVPGAPTLHYSYNFVFDVGKGEVKVNGSNKQYPAYDIILNSTVLRNKVPAGLGNSPIALLWGGNIYTGNFTQY